MALTVNKLDSLCRFRLALGSNPLPQEISIIDAANEAGWWLAAARQWNYLRRNPYDLDLTADQSYILLPSDFSAVLSIAANQLAHSLRMESIEVVADFRHGLSTGGYGGYIGAVVTPTVALTGPNPEKRIEIYPTPGATLANAWRLVYRAGFTEVANGTDHIILPRFLERVFVDVVVAHLASSIRDGADLDDLLAKIDGRLDVLGVHDAAEQQTLGPNRHSASDMAREDSLWNLPNNVTVTLGP